MSNKDLDVLADRLFQIFGNKDFLAMKGLANELPIFIQTYETAQEDALRRMVGSLATRLRNKGIGVKVLDLLDLVLEELKAHGILDDLLTHEAEWERRDVFETLQNYSDPKTHLVPRLIDAMSVGDTQLTLITGPGRVYPFLRTHTILESLQPAMLRHPVVVFFPGEYTQDLGGGSHLRLFGSVPSPRIANPYYRALNLAHYRI